MAAPPLGAQGGSGWSIGCGSLVLARPALIYPIGFELDKLAIFGRDHAGLPAVRLLCVGEVL
jgi:hypothetical protein